MTGRANALPKNQTSGKPPKRDSLWVLDSGSAITTTPAFARIHTCPAGSPARGDEDMQNRVEFEVDEAIIEIAVLLADAYRRRASILSLPTSAGTAPSTGELAIKGHRSVHELTLTRRREESRT